VSIKNEYDLTSGQKALWFIHALGGTAQSVYNESLIYSLNGSLSVDVLQNTVNTLLEKHPMLRAGFDQDNFGNLLQRIDNQTELKVSVINDIAEANLADFISQEIARPFDLKKAPLMHISLIRKGATEHLLLIVIHHIIMDGISIAILMNDFNKYYNYFAKGFTDLEYIVLPNYVDCVRAERLHCLSQEYADKVNALVETLKGYSGLNFLPSPVSSSDKNDIFVGDRVYFNLDAKLYSRVIAFAKANRCTIFNFLLAAYNIFISQYAQTQDIVVGVPFANRAHNSDRTIVGYYANALPVRILLNPKQSFTELLSHIRKIAFSYLGKQEVAFEHIADKLDIERKAPGQHPLIQALFTWSPTVDALKLSLENITTQLEHHYFSKTAKFDLSLSMLERNNQSVLAYFEYRTSLFDRAMVETFATGFQSLIKNILNTPSDSISSLRFMDECEEDRLREKFFINNFPVIVKKSLVGRF
jgi:myxalamid-type nonribosomal peptide synthetase MxaA